jgi:diketogulonate reductase-like aldo/keto reductase
LKENVAAAEIKLSEEEVAEVRRIAESAEASKTGERYPPGMAEQLFADTPALEN